MVGGSSPSGRASFLLGRSARTARFRWLGTPGIDECGRGITRPFRRFPVHLARNPRAHHPWCARSAGRPFTGWPSASASPLGRALWVAFGASPFARSELVESLSGRVHQAPLRAAVLLLRRACNLPLKEVSAMAGVSPSRVSKIQSHIERTEPSGPTATLLDRYKVKH